MKTLLLAALFTTSVAHAAQFVVEAKHKLSSAEIEGFKLAAIEEFGGSKSEYFSRLYVVTGSVSKSQLEKLPWAKLVEGTFDLKEMSLEPVSNPNRFVADELFPYQWPLQNQGQTYVREKDDIHNIPLVGVAGADINWKGVYNKIPAKRPIVAVLDSGLDVTHPDLKGNLWFNPADCGQKLYDENNDYARLPQIDQDNNGFKGDCNGYDTSEDFPDISDRDGHGTHVAGIIAAAKNEIGIVGVNPNALIMPIKVMKSAGSNSKISPSVAFGRGIHYARTMGADIVNLSLGWPRYLSTNYLNKAVEEALRAGLILVAAAGNNDSAEPLFPCAIPGVICVAASTLDGSVAGFSNYGGHVDAVAPGEGILSLAPIKTDGEFFSVPGYDIKSGTSQSAPHLVGMISIMRAQDPTFSTTDALARIYSAKMKADKRKYVLGGDMSWDAMSKEITTPVIRPVFKADKDPSGKEIERGVVLVGENTSSFYFFNVRNFGTDSEPVEVSVESLSAGVEINFTTTTSALVSGRGMLLKVPVTVTDLKSESNIKVKVTIKGAEGTLDFYNEIPVFRDISQSPKTKTFNFSFNGAEKGLGKVVEGRLENLIYTVGSYVNNSKKSELYTNNLVSKLPLDKENPRNNNNETTITLYRLKGETYNELENKIVVDRIKKAVTLKRVDLNLDGVEDYIFHAERFHVLDDGKHGLTYHEFFFYDSNLKPLWAKMPSAKLVLDAGFDNRRPELDFNIDIDNFMRLDHPELGKILAPAFMAVRKIPEVDQKADFLNRYDQSYALRLYYLEPKVQSKELIIHTVNNLDWETSIKKQLNASWYDTISVESLLPTSESDLKNGTLRLMVSVGNRTKRQIMIASFEAKKSTVGAVLPQTVLQTDSLEPLMSVGANGLEQVGETYMNIYDGSRAKVVSTKEAAQVAAANYTHNDGTDVIMGLLASFENGDKKLTILESRDEIITLTTTNGKVTKSTRPKLRFSFINSEMLSELYTPVIFNRDGVQAPALYVDTTVITANRVNLFEEQNGKLVASIQNTLRVPNSCKPMNPRFSATGGAHEFVFLCLMNAATLPEYVIRTYEMK